MPYIIECLDILYKLRVLFERVFLVNDPAVVQEGLDYLVVWTKVVEGDD